MTAVTDEDLIGYLFDAIPADERAAVESHLHANPSAVARLDELRRSFAPLEADRVAVSPPVGLAERTLGRLAALLAEPAAEPTATPSTTLPRAPREHPELAAVGGRFRLDILVAAGIAFLAFGLLTSAIGKMRAQNEMLACQNTLRTVHTGLTGYADTHQGRYPQVGVGEKSTADSFAATLAESGQVPADFRPCCPAAVSLTPGYVGYTYTLGYRAPSGGLFGFRKVEGAADEHDLVPISADFPAASAAPAAPGPTCPHDRGMNVLFAGGNVRVTTSALIGPGGDDIFRNLYGDVAAGANRTDIVLGRPGDRP